MSVISRQRISNPVLAFLLFTCLQGCTPTPIAGPDKQFTEMASGAVTGAGAGAVTGFQISAATGPGAFVGAGIGAVSGAFQGIGADMTEEQQIEMQNSIFRAQQIANAQEILKEHYKRRAELHPTRDIFPADLFFFGDEVKLRPESVWLVSEIAKLNKQRLPYSRLVVAVYAKSKDHDSTYANYLTERRSRALVDGLVRSGLEPRRLMTRPQVVPEAILIDPLDRPDRYNQAVELIAIDR